MLRRRPDDVADRTHRQGRGPLLDGHPGHTRIRTRRADGAFHSEAFTGGEPLHTIRMHRPTTPIEIGPGPAASNAAGEAQSLGLGGGGQDGSTLSTAKHGVLGYS